MISRKRSVSGSSYTARPGDGVIDVFHSGTYTVAIPNTLWPDGYELTITDLSGNAGALPITITATSIDGGSVQYVIQEDRGWATFVFNAFFNAWVHTSGTLLPTQSRHNLTGNVNDFSAPLPVRLVSFTTNGSSHTVSGITSGSIEARLIVIANVNSVPGSLVNLTHQDGASAAANRFICPGGVTKALDAGDIVSAIWDGSPNARWRIFP